MQWHNWRTAEELGTKKSFYTDDGQKYTGDGYVQDFSLGMTTEEFQAELSSLFESGPGNPKFIDYDTAVVIIVFNCYEPS